MAVSPEPRPDHDVGSGRHLLGPHVVGQRVVVRRLLRGETGPTGGPAFTDLLGICTSWGEGACVVRPESGPPVTIPLADIVSGKPVPPRPSVRHRVTARDAEEHVLSLWPHLETEPLGDWLLRSDPRPVGRLRRRANSCLAMGDPGIPVQEASARVRDFYSRRERPVWAQVELGSDVESALVAAGWEPLGGADVHFELASLAQVRRRLRGAMSDSVDGDFGERSARVSVELDGAEAAAGEAVVDGDWLGVHSVQVAPAYRRRGLARAVLASLLEWGGERGTTTVWLHVETDNVPAIALYESLGFTTHHTVRYLRG